MNFNIKDKAETWDATYAFPRPANEQYLSSYKAFLRVSKDFAVGFFSLLFSLGSSGVSFHVWGYARETFHLSFLEGAGALLTLFFLITNLIIWIIFAVDVASLCFPYRLELQRESHGGRTWAKAHDLRQPDVDALRLAGAVTAGLGVVLAPFKHFFALNPTPKFNIFLSLKRLAQAIVVYGPPGSGKSTTFFMPVIRQFASCGGAIVLDVKGELFNYTAHSYANVYRLDIMNPLYSDWLDLFSGCYRNPDLAYRLASYMVGYDPNKASNKEPIWDQSATSMLSILILYLCEKKEYPTPRDILRFLATNPIAGKRFDEVSGKYVNYSPLNEAFDACKYSFVRELWGNNFAKLPEETFGSVKFNADTALRQFLSPKVNEILRPPTASEKKKGRRRIDFASLRRMFACGQDGKRGTALYVVVSPSDAMNLDVVLRVIFSMALDTLRESAQEGTPVLVALDEAGNVPLAKLPEGINTDRSKGICYFLGYQDKNQPLTQYGRDNAGAFLSTAGVNIFLPGIDDDTAEMASKRLGETTILQRSSSDARNDGFDHEKVSEAGRKLMYPQELTGMKWFTQCVITIKGVAPIRTKIPPDAKLQDVRICQPRRVMDEVSEEVLRSMGLLAGRGEFLLEPPPINERNPPERSTTQADPAESEGPDGVLIPAPGETGLSEDDSPSGVTAGALALPVQLASTPETYHRNL